MLETLNVFEGEDEFQKRVEKSTLGEADAYLNKSVRAGDRGATLSPYERAVVEHHHGDVFKEEDISSAA